MKRNQVSVKRVNSNAWAKKPSFWRNVWEYKTGLMIAAATVSATLLSGGCGRPENGASNIQATTVAPTAPYQGSQGFGYISCPAGMTSLGGYQCVPQGSFEQVCHASEGILMTGTDGRQLCKLFFDYTNPSAPRIEIDVYGGFYYLNPDDPTGRYALNLNIPVRRGDKLTFAASGGWGTATSAAGVSGSINIAGLFSVPYTSPSGLSCYNAVSVAGTLMNPATGYPMISTETGAPGGTPQTYQGMIAGLLGTDGTRVFPIGGAINDLPMINDGYLKVGINAPISYYNCFEYFLTKIIVTHCEDSSGITFPCPQ